MARRRTEEAKRIGLRIAELRERAHLTQQAAAERLRVSYRAYQSWEQGTATPRWHNYQRLSELFGIPVEEILGPPAPSVDGAQLDRIEAQLAEALSRLDALENLSEQTAAAVESQLGQRLSRPETTAPEQTSGTRRAGGRRGPGEAPAR